MIVIISARYAPVIHSHMFAMTFLVPLLSTVSWYVLSSESCVHYLTCVLSCLYYATTKCTSPCLSQMSHTEILPLDFTSCVLALSEALTRYNVCRYSMQAFSDGVLDRCLFVFASLDRSTYPQLKTWQPPDGCSYPHITLSSNRRRMYDTTATLSTL